MNQRAREYRTGERLPGTVYQVVRLIGAGGMGAVYDVEDTTIGKRYVLKALHPQLGAREDLARRMQSEARTLARLNHPNIVEVITAGVTGDDLRLPFFVMERLNGQSLRVVLDKKGRLELPDAYHIAIDLLDALDHAHDKGVIHRDVKPDNIFLHRTSAGITVTKLLDFGIQSLLDATMRETAGRFLGTLRYAAPEQLRGDKPTPAVDVYAAALVLYEMIAGRGPFDDESEPQAIGAAHMDKRPPPLSKFVDVPRELDSLLGAALAKAPRLRPRDAFSFAASLRNLKRALAGGQARESTEERATAAAIAGAPRPASSLVAVQRRSSQGPYVISPVQESPTAQTLLPTTTMRGMPTPTGVTAVPIDAASPGVPTATSPGLVDRAAPTRSIVPEAPPPPRDGTEPLDRQPPSGGAPDDPPESAPPASDPPEVQTLSLGAPLAAVSRSPRPGLRIAAAVTLGALASVCLLVVSWRRAPSWRAPAQPRQLTPAALAASDSPAPWASADAVAPVSSAAPVTAAAASVTPPAASAGTPAPPGAASASPPKHRAQGGAASKASTRLDRPGPGF